MIYETRKAAEDHLMTTGFTKGNGGKWINSETKLEAKLGPTTKNGVRIFYGH